MGRLIASEDDFVSADIRLNGAVTPVKLRLKGDLTDHLEDDKWSYRIKVKGDNTLYGLAEFSIQHPKTRNYLAEWVYHQALKREDIIALRYDFVEVSVNGKNQGIFALEEHFNSRLIEHNHRRAGPIIRLSEEQYWLQFGQVPPSTNSRLLSSASFNAAPLDAFQSKTIATDSTFRQQYIRATTLFESLRLGEIRARDVFDIDKLAMYLAITELLGAEHSAIWHHMRFYYNPITGKLEPIGFDGNAGNPLVTLTLTLIEYEDYAGQIRQIFYYARQDPLFNTAYKKALHRVAQPSYLQELYQAVEPEFKQKLSIIHKSYPDYEFPYETIEENRKHILHIIHPKDGLRVHIKEQRKDTLVLQAGSTQSLPVRPQTLHTPTGASLPLNTEPELPGRRLHTGISYRELSLVLPDTAIISDSLLALSTVSYNIEGVDSLFHVPVIPFPYRQASLLDNDLIRNGPTDHLFPFLTKNTQNRTISVQTGNWIIHQNLIMPEGYTFSVQPGTTFDLTKHAAIVARGPIQFKGSSDNPIQVISSDSTGQGLLVLNAESPSLVRHTRFTGLGHLDQHGWSQTGSVTFHESIVSMHNVEFEHNKAEDALNIFRSSYQMDSVRFSHTYSDAFDGDFSNGIITNSVFEELGNDGIDVSGSFVTLKNVRIQGAGDKALSAGESSHIDGHGLEINLSEIAIASKDLSAVTLTGVHISKSRLGVTLFQKKPEFGPASFEATNYIIEDTEVPSLIEEGSLFMVNGERIPANKKNVSDLLYGNLYGTASN